jgi:predicted O-linked N-acetylglucosamine transferase (SPINDLY family)
LIKLAVATLHSWSKILHAVPKSELLVHAGEGLPREHVRQQLSAQGIAVNRVRFAAALPLLAYFHQYQQIDIALDPFPFPGGTTTCDALWMGVPVVSLAGKTAVSLAGRSILSNIGLGDLVADSTERYVQIAVTLAGDLARSASLRSTMRQRMQASPLMDAATFDRNIEAAFRTMWRQWCESYPSQSASTLFCELDGPPKG